MEDRWEMSGRHGGDGRERGDGSDDAMREGGECEGDGHDDKESTAYGMEYRRLSGRGEMIKWPMDAKRREGRRGGEGEEGGGEGGNRMTHDR
eukprot:3747853-Prymnesium_polylepis.1